MDNMGGAYSKH